MAQDFNQFPIYDPLVKGSSAKMGDTWISAMTSFIQTLIEYLSQFGIFVPQITTDERNTIQSPVLGQIIYNTTLNKFQGYENGAWVNLV